MNRTAPTPLSFYGCLLALKTLYDLFGVLLRVGRLAAGRLAYRRSPRSRLRRPAGAFAGVPTAAGVGDGFAEAFAGGAVCVLALPAFFGVGVGFAPALALAGTGTRITPVSGGMNGLPEFGSI